MSDSDSFQLHAVNKCFQVDELINKFIDKRKAKDKTSNLFYSPTKQKNDITHTRRNSYKSSLADWRSLYGDT